MVKLPKMIRMEVNTDLLTPDEQLWWQNSDNQTVRLLLWRLADEREKNAKLQREVAIVRQENLRLGTLLQAGMEQPNG